MVKSMIGLLRENQSFIQVTRYYEGCPSDSQITAVTSLFTFNILVSSLLLFPVSTSRNHPPCDIVFILPLSRCADFIRIFIGYYWLQRKPKPHLYVKHNRTDKSAAVGESN